ncbi:MAG: TfoX/Sxy family DNA transformation protein [Melioribacteraceae bacterium]|nr:TfoX/Sxy family DNA transformation protein [Melioribacteraceae bacterium]
MKNLGPESRKKLEEVGIFNYKDLLQFDSISVYVEVKKKFPDTSLNFLWALEGAIQNKDWRDITKSEKQNLLWILGEK